MIIRTEKDGETVIAVEEETETWHGFHGDITAPKGTFEKIFNDCDTEDDSI